MEQDDRKCISLRNISKNYKEKIIFNDLSYDFYFNTCYLLQGDSGIGKSTLLNIIAGYEDVDSGVIIRSNDNMIQYMFQDSMLFSNLTVMENIAIKYYANSEITNWNIEELQKELSVILEKFKIKDLINRKVHKLSGGERQRVALAGMMLTDSSILLLDEPVSNIDPENRKEIINMINEYSSGKVVIIATHDDMPGIKNEVQIKLRNGKIYEKKNDSN